VSDIPIKATLKVSLAPWRAPNFARHAQREEGTEGSAIPVADLDDDALEDLALAWVRDLYRNAGRTYAPFHKPVKAAPSE
jgi:hypothetical protein